MAKKSFNENIKIGTIEFIAIGKYESSTDSVSITKYDEVLVFIDGDEQPEGTAKQLLDSFNAWDILELEIIARLEKYLEDDESEAPAVDDDFIKDNYYREDD
jgi:hypothetical protein